MEVVAAVESFEGDGVVLADGQTIRPDVVIGAPLVNGLPRPPGS